MKRLLTIAGVGLGLSVAAFGQKPKSMDEQKALQEMFAAESNPDAQITAANTVLEKFADTEFKSIALFFIARDYQMKNDFAKSVTYGERALEADPKNYQAMLLVASEYAQNTKDTDFDKEDKLKKADKYANDAVAALKDAPKPNPGMSDPQWDGAKKDMTANGYEILGQIALVRKKPDVAQSSFQQAIDTAADKDPATYVRLAMTDNMLGKYDDAIAAAEKAMNSPNVNPAVKQYAQAERARAMGKKGGGTATPAASPTTTPAPTTPPAPKP